MTNGWMKRITGWLGLVAMFTAFAAPVQAAPYSPEYDDDYYYQRSEVNDPLEPLNRGIFKFNEVFDMVIMEPVSRAYVFVVPEFGRDKIHNAVSNLGEPVNMLNGFLQGEPKRGFTSMWRFILNSTFGVLGFFDFAAYNAELYPVDEDFGQTMGYYGWNGGPYIVLPFLGPSNTRDTFGRVVDVFSNPFNYVEDDKFVYGRVAVTAVDARSRNLELVDDIYETSLDPYATFRSAYTQRRNALIRNNDPGEGSGGVGY